MGPEENLADLIERSDHLSVLRYIRAHKLFDPELVLHHGILLLGEDLSKHKRSNNLFFTSIFPLNEIDESERLGALEQICIAALHVKDRNLADEALSQIVSSIGNKSVRYRRLLALRLESTNDISGATKIYDSLLKENPSSAFALKRKYCVLKSQLGKETEAREALNDYLERNGSDVGAWAEMSKFCAEMGDYSGAAYCYEEIVLCSPLSSAVHCTMGEWYATIGGKDNLKLARKHMAQSLDLDPKNLRAMYGLAKVAGDFLKEMESKKSKNDFEEEDLEVAKELEMFSIEKLRNIYKGTSMKILIDQVFEKKKSQF